MDPGQALADLKQISTQVQEAVIFEADGTVIASTLEDGTAMATAARGLLEAAAETEQDKPVVQLEAALPEGSVALVREGERAIAATTEPGPTIGLVLYDLRTCLRFLDEQAEKPKKPSASRRKKTDSGAAT